jgi:hypothetical protein
VFLDLDEMMVPRGMSKTLEETLVTTACQDKAQTIIRSAFFRKQWTNDEKFSSDERIVKRSLVSLLKTKRERKVLAINVHAKYIVAPEMIEALETLAALQFLATVGNNTGEATCVLLAKECLLHHYRYYDEFAGDWMIDRKMHEFTKAIVERTGAVWEAVSARITAAAVAAAAADIAAADTADDMAVDAAVGADVGGGVGAGAETAADSVAINSVGSPTGGVAALVGTAAGGIAAGVGGGLAAGGSLPAGGDGLVDGGSLSPQGGVADIGGASLVGQGLGGDAGAPPPGDSPVLPDNSAAVISLIPPVNIAAAVPIDAPAVAMDAPAVATNNDGAPAEAAPPAQDSMAAV